MMIPAYDGNPLQAKSHTPGFALHTTVAGKCPSSPEESMAKGIMQLPFSSVSSGTPKRGTTSRLTGADSLLPPVYSEAWAKGIPRTPFSSLRDAAHGKHAGRKTNVLSVFWTGKEEKGNLNGKKEGENREVSLGFPGSVKPVFTKDRKPLGKGKDH
ncbi:hypothetical protein TNCV_3467411 [Trichonephila clavipes]|nr:hypothetical protein TNCV_3467411 [Trichonephila clavipes]